MLDRRGDFAGTIDYNADEASVLSRLRKLEAGA
jgi:hypothetical protein